MKSVDFLYSDTLYKSPLYKKYYKIIDFYRKASLEELSKNADTVCRENYGNKVFLRGLIEFSNYCSMDCLYCGIRKSNTKVERYRLTEEEILSTVKMGFKIGFRTFVLQSGEDSFFSTKIMAGIIEKIKNITGGGAAITLSCGIRPKSDYRIFKNAGADRYLLRFETSEPALHHYLRNGIPLENRLKALYDLKELGYETGSGYMLGLPGETEEIRIKNALLCVELELDMIGIGPFIPHPDTPLANAKKESLELTLRATSLLRLLLPKSNIPATTAAGSISPNGRERMLAAGANVLMPNLTPTAYKKNYLLYPGKICIDEDGEKCISCLSFRLNSIGKDICFERGDSIKYREGKKLA